MTATIFVDTSVLVSALDDADLKKHEAARAWRSELWKSRRGRVSFQVLQEFYVKVCERFPTAREKARSEVRDLLAWRPAAVDADVLERCWKIQDRHQLPFRDAMILAAAKSIPCEYLLTEDLQAGQKIDGVLIINPFACDPASLPPL
jgi:predicted nucleic acid-binding protein